MLYYNQKEGEQPSRKKEVKKMFVVYKKLAHASYEKVGYVETFEEFVAYCKSIGLERFMDTNYYGKYTGNGYYSNIHYAEKIEKLIIDKKYIF